MRAGRLEAFSDGVLAIVITIMVLELKVPEGSDLHALRPLLPLALAYLLSFINLGIYWNNHHHLFQVTKFVNGRILWANLGLLFWLSLFPVTTAWMGETDAAATPVAIYGLVSLLAAIAYFLLQSTIVACHAIDPAVAENLGRDLKGKSSPVLYAAAIPLAFVNPWISIAVYVGVAVMWIVPDRRVEAIFNDDQTTA